MASNIGTTGLAEAGVLGLVILVVGMMMHPFQFAATQILEGYWGPSAVARFAMFSRASIHAERRRKFLAGLAQAKVDAELADASFETSYHLAAVRAAEAKLLQASLDYTAFEAAADRYPEVGERIMPTRLGNILRRHEDLAGRSQGVEALDAVPRLMAVAPAEQIAHVNDARTDLDLAVRLVVSWLLLAVLSFLLLMSHGPWLVVPLGSYALAWASYRGAVHAADEYGSALYVLIDVNHELIKPTTGQLIVASQFSQR